MFLGSFLTLGKYANLRNIFTNICMKPSHHPHETLFRLAFTLENFRLGPWQMLKEDFQLNKMNYKKNNCFRFSTNFMIVVTFVASIYLLRPSLFKSSKKGRKLHTYMFRLGGEQTQ